MPHPARRVIKLHKLMGTLSCCRIQNQIATELWGIVTAYRVSVLYTFLLDARSQKADVVNARERTERGSRADGMSEMEGKGLDNQRGSKRLSRVCRLELVE